MEAIKLKGCVVRDKDDYLAFYRSKEYIHRGKTEWVMDKKDNFICTLPGDIFLDLNFEDDPIDVEIEIKRLQ